MCLVNKTTNCLARFLIAVKGIVREKYFKNSRKDEGNTCCEGCKQWVIKGDWQSKQAYLVFFLCILFYHLFSLKSSFYALSFTPMPIRCSRNSSGLQEILQTCGDGSDHGGHWYQKWKTRAGGKGKMAKPVLSSENQKEFGACMTVWVHLKDICFLIATGFLCLNVLPYHQTF